MGEDAFCIPLACFWVLFLCSPLPLWCGSMWIHAGSPSQVDVVLLGKTKPCKLFTEDLLYIVNIDRTEFHTSNGKAPYWIGLVYPGRTKQVFLSIIFSQKSGSGYILYNRHPTSAERRVITSLDSPILSGPELLERYFSCHIIIMYHNQ